MTKKVYTVEETAKVLGISRASAYDAVRKGEIPSVRIGRRLLVPAQKVDELLGVESAPERVEPETRQPGRGPTVRIEREEPAERGQVCQEIVIRIVIEDRTARD